MKWSKPEKLSAYGVSMEGWPSDVPIRNPSQMSQQEIIRIYELISNKEIRFQRITSNDPSQSDPGKSLNKERTSQVHIGQRVLTDEEMTSSTGAIKGQSPGSGSETSKGKTGRDSLVDSERLESSSPEHDAGARKRKRNASVSD